MGDKILSLYANSVTIREIQATFKEMYDAHVSPKQIAHWAKIGEMMEDNPDLPYEFG